MDLHPEERGKSHPRKQLTSGVCSPLPHARCLGATLSVLLPPGHTPHPTCRGLTFVALRPSWASGKGWASAPPPWDRNCWVGAGQGAVPLACARRICPRAFLPTAARGLTPECSGWCQDAKHACPGAQCGAEAGRELIRSRLCSKARGGRARPRAGGAQSSPGAPDCPLGARALLASAVLVFLIRKGPRDLGQGSLSATQKVKARIKVLVSPRPCAPVVTIRRFGGGGGCLGLP